MIFSSTIFLVYFLPAFLLCYHLVGKQLKNWVLLLFSLLFYAWGAPVFVYVLLISALTDFYLVQGIYSSDNKRKKRLLLSFSLAIKIGLLGYFKYANFFIANANELLAVAGFNAFQWTKIIMPIGISFFTFESITYSVDVFRGKHEPLSNLKDYLVYLLAFPKLIAGPIVRYQEIADQIKERKATADDRLLGFYRFCIGLAKKVLIANVLAQQANASFDGDIAHLSSGYAWFAIVAYTFQIYFDFSGYSDMAIGIGRMIGFRFPENFNAPYVSQNISEFWRRWHMTLGNFMRDYLYIPLGGNRVDSKMRLYFNLWIVFVLSGFWHGASWNYILWGVYHGIFLILDRLFLIRWLTKLGRPFAILFTFFVVAMGWVLFRLENLEHVWLFYERLFSFDKLTHVSFFENFLAAFYIAICFAILPAFGFGKRLMDYVFQTDHLKFSNHLIWMLLAIGLFIVSWSSILGSGYNPFIYYRF